VLALGVVIFIVGIVVTSLVGAGGVVLILIGLVGVIWDGWRILRARGTGIKPPTQP
jgi:hypothetical protein